MKSAARGGSGQPGGPCEHRPQHPQCLLSGLYGFHWTEGTSFGPGTEQVLVNESKHQFSNLLCSSYCPRCFTSYDLILFSQPPLSGRYYYPLHSTDEETEAQEVSKSPTTIDW